MAKNFFRTFVTVMFLMAGVAASAKTVKTKIFVDGKCDHCKERIEKAALKIKGVSAAVWNQEQKCLYLKYNSDKTDTLAVEKALVNVGHDAGKLKADDATYEALPPCCHYRK